MSEKPARFEVHHMPLAAIDAVLQICRHIKVEIPRTAGVNINILHPTYAAWWIRVECVGEKRHFTLKFVAYYGFTGAIFHTPSKEYFFTMEVKPDHSYNIAQQEIDPFGNAPWGECNPFATEDFYGEQDEAHRRRHDGSMTANGPTSIRN
ncbi:MAG: hypothetical protein HYY60_02575 [Parcubacteria group bacterium]|nr:hypothetical protein [Parcubacteria group bacterium]